MYFCEQLSAPEISSKQSKQDKSLVVKGTHVECVKNNAPSASDFELLGNQQSGVRSSDIDSIESDSDTDKSVVDQE